MFEDEKGYLVTEMVWEEVSEDDEPEPKVHKAVEVKAKAPAEQSGKEEKKTKSAKAKAAPEASKGGAQKSMMSFFGGGKK